MGLLSLLLKKAKTESYFKQQQQYANEEIYNLMLAKYYYRNGQN
jgi:hypothetical protein